MVSISRLVLQIVTLPHLTMRICRPKIDINLLYKFKCVDHMLKQSVLRRMQYWQDYKVCEFFHYVHMIKNGHLVARMTHRIVTLFYFIKAIKTLV